MRLIGYCVKCHRIRPVQVRLPRPGHVQVGVCLDCERKR